MDLVIAVVVFGFIAVVFYSLLTIQERPSVDDLQVRAQTIENKLLTNATACGAIDNQVLTQAQLLCLYEENPDRLRSQFGITGKYCIYVEDNDGNILIVTNATSSKIRTAVGDDALIVAGTPCGTSI